MLPFSGSHTAANIASEIEEILNKWGIKEKVNFAVTDNAANILEAIREHLDIKHFGCFAHKINYFCKNVYK